MGLIFLALFVSPPIQNPSPLSKPSALPPTITCDTVSQHGTLGTLLDQTLSQVGFTLLSERNERVNQE